jgi:GNAT superfamily N-acetyltransferase
MHTLLLASALFAQTSLIENSVDVRNSAAVPPALEAWVPWAMDQSQANCPGTAFNQQDKSCVLPGTVRLDVSTGGARFSQNAQRFTRGEVRLPGSIDTAWPQSVTVNGQATPVLQRDGAPVVYLAAGTARIEGAFAWSKLPERLRVPAAMPLSFSKDGLTVAAPERDGDELWLGRAQEASRTADALEVQVHRLLSDGMPMILATEITLQVSGEAREVTIGPALLPGFAPLALSGDLTAKLNPDGSLSVQLRPGEWTLSLQARALSPMSELALAPAVGEWPAEESLSFQADTSLRSVQLDGLAATDPQQASVPNAWRAFPAYIFTPEARLTIKIDSRGRDADAPNRLTLTRDLWLDFSGRAFSTKDEIRGAMVRDWRVGMQAPYVMTRAQSPDSNGSLQPLLVTKDRLGTGVEVRSTSLNLTTAARIQATGALPATGYGTTMESANITLNTPPGWTLIAAMGATDAPSAWLDRWTVFIAFSVALCALAAWRLGGWPLGAAVLGYAVISAFEYSAPKLWLLALLLLALLLRQLKTPRRTFDKMVRVACALGFAVLLLQSLNFTERQARLALHPQLEFDQIGVGKAESDRHSIQLQTAISEPAMEMAPPPPPPPPPAAEPTSPAVIDAAAAADMLEEVQVMGSRIRRSDSENMSNYWKSDVSRKQMNRYAANSVVQAGAAEPNWRWRQHNVSIAGPITPEQTLRMVLLPPWGTSALRILALALLGFSLYQLGRTLWTQRRPPQAANSEPSGQTHAASALATIALVLSATFFSALPLRPALAQATPEAEVLSELKDRLNRAPLCAPQCVALPNVQVRIEGDAFAMTLTAHVGARSLLSLPSGERSLAAVRITIDGAEASFVRRSDAFAELILEPGVHFITLQGTARADRIPLDFPLQPARVQVSANGWEAGGVRDEKLTSRTLDLVRAQRTDVKDTGGKTSAQFPAYVRVLRQLRLDLEWRVETTVQRLTNAESGLTVRVPLLPGERPLDAGIQVLDGVALVPIQAGESEAVFTAALDLLPEITLNAPMQAERVEVWTVEASPVWHVEYKGVPLSLTPLGDSDDLQLRFDPLPSETLLLTLSRPEAAPGPAYRIDEVNVSTRPGERARDTTLRFTLAATQGGRHSIQLPQGAELLSVSKNEEAQTLRLREHALELPVTPGENRFEVNFREPLALGHHLVLPRVDLKLPSANIRLNLELPNSRWLLWAHGPTLGPAVLYWATLLVVLLLAAGLAKSGRTALGFGAWALLGLGLTGFGWQAFVIVALWFIALQWRMQHGNALGDWSHRFVQLALVGWSVLAIGCIVGGAMNGLLTHLDMQVHGNGSGASALSWFADLTVGDAQQGVLPSAGALTLPSWIYKALMLAWALWLAFALLRWLRYAWLALCTGGGWRALPKLTRGVSTAPDQSNSSLQNSGHPIPGNSGAAPPPLPERASAGVLAQLHSAALEDVEALTQLARSHAAVSAAALYTPAGLARYLDASFGAAALRAELADSDVEFWLADVAGQTLGMFKLTHNREAPYQKLLPATQLEHLYVAASANGQGIGGQLLRHAIAQAKRSGSDELWLRLPASDTQAQAIYASFGFVDKLALPFATDLGEIGMKVFGKSLND